MEWKFSNAAAGSRSSGKSLVVSHMIDQSDQRPKATVGRHVLTGNAGAAGGLPPPLSPLPLQGEESSPRPDDFFQQDSSSTPRLYSPLFSTSPLLDHPVRLSDNDCDLDFVHEGEGRYTTRTDGHLANMWSGARSEVGLRGQAWRESGYSKFMFEVRILDEFEVPAPERAPSKRTSLCRVGWSCRDTPTYALGLRRDSWAFGATGWKSHGGNFDKFGEEFHQGDIISCAFDLETKQVSYAKNGRSLGTAFTIDPASFERGIYPHVMLLNVRVEVLFACRCRLPVSFPCHCLHGHDFRDFLPFEAAIDLGLTTSPELPHQHPEVHILVGLPKVGKTAWAEEHMKKHPEKHFYVLSTNEIMSRYHHIKTFPNKDS